jgi:hypothetical protein
LEYVDVQLQQTEVKLGKVRQKQLVQAEIEEKEQKLKEANDELRARSNKLARDADRKSRSRSRIQVCEDSKQEVRSSARASREDRSCSKSGSRSTHSRSGTISRSPSRRRANPGPTMSPSAIQSREDRKERSRWAENGWVEMQETGHPNHRQQRRGGNGKSKGKAKDKGKGKCKSKKDKEQRPRAPSRGNSVIAERDRIAEQERWSSRSWQNQEEE